MTYKVLIMKSVKCIVKLSLYRFIFNCLSLSVSIHPYIYLCISLPVFLSICFTVYLYACLPTYHVYLFNKTSSHAIIMQWFPSSSFQNFVLFS